MFMFDAISSLKKYTKSSILKIQYLLVTFNFQFFFSMNSFVSFLLKFSVNFKKLLFMKNETLPSPICIYYIPWVEVLLHGMR